MTDTTTPLLGLIQMGTGGDNNSWGINLNATIVLIEDAIAATTLVSTTGGTVTLNAAQSLSAIIKLTGALTSPLMIVVPSTSKKWTFINQCTGNYATQANAGGSAVNVPTAKPTDIVSDGTGALYRDDYNFIGNVIYHAAASAPGGTFECNGAAISRTLFADLYGVIGTTWGAGDGFTTFNLPNGYSQGSGLGSFLRSRTASVAVGTYQANQNLTHTHTGSGTTGNENASHYHTASGTTGTMNSNQSHAHNYYSTGGQVLMQSGSSTYVATEPGGYSTTVPTNTDHTHSFSFNTGYEVGSHQHTYSFTTSTGSADGAEARPEALTMMMCIRY
jgi:microcystin-dependent protein